MGRSIRICPENGVEWSHIKLRLCGGLLLQRGRHPYGAYPKDSTNVCRSIQLRPLEEHGATQARQQGKTTTDITLLVDHKNI